MKILYHSAAPNVKTGYGRATREIVSRLHGNGHEIAVQTLSSIKNEPIWWHGEEYHSDIEKPVKLYPSSTKFGVGDAEEHYKDWGADFYFTHFDTWLEAARKNIPEMEVPYSSYVIVDHYPAPDAVVDQVSNAAETVCMSEYAEQALGEKGIRPRVIPHAVDVDKFHPLDDPPSKVQLDKKDGGINVINTDERFIIGIVAANHGDRKHIPEQMQAFKQFLNNVDDEALLYVHTEQNAMEGFNLSEVQEEIGIPDENLAVPSMDSYHGIGDDILNAWYNTFDVLLNCSRGESWGFAVTEAQAAGTPCIVTNFSSMPEQLGLHPGDYKWLSWMKDDKRGGWEKAPHGVVVNPVIGEFRERVSAKQFLCHPDDIAEALEYYYNNPEERKLDGEVAANYVRNNYTWENHIVPRFKELFDDMEEKV